jgi:hypothetical protein
LGERKRGLDVTLGLAVVVHCRGKFRPPTAIEPGPYRDNLAERPPRPVRRKSAISEGEKQ